MNNYYFYIFFLIVIFTGSILFINFLYIEKNLDHKNNYLRRYSRLILPLIAMTTFFMGCFFVASIISQGNIKDQYSGIAYMCIIAIILTVLNFTVLKQQNIRKYIRGKKFSRIGVIMALGVSAIVFGFLDNFGMKLGTDALDDNFLQIFLSPFSQDKRYVNYKSYIANNLKHMNAWSNGKWRTIINHVLRHRKLIEKYSRQNNNSMKDLVIDIKEFMEQDAKPLEIPEEILKLGDRPGGVRDFVNNIKEKYDIIDGSKAMMGNTFSDFIGAILGAAIINLFVYMTAYDGIFTGDDSIDDSAVIKNLNKYTPFMEALLIALGCTVPIFLNIAMTRDSNNNNNRNAWLVVIIIAVIVVLMMGLSVSGIKDMTVMDKKKSIKKTIIDMVDRLDIRKDNKQEANLYEVLDVLVKKL